MVQHVTIRIYGHVQGVSFRVSAKRLADQLGIYGSIQNISDGSIQIEAEGEEAAIQKFLTWCQKGPISAHVKKVESNLSEPKNYQNFTIIN